MASSVKYSEEPLNYYRICYVTTDILTEGLREIFKQEWDSRYKATLGCFGTKSSLISPEVTSQM